MYSAWSAFKNNEVLKEQAEQVRRQEAQDRMQDAAVTGKSAKLGPFPNCPKVLILRTHSIRRTVTSFSSV